MLTSLYHICYAPFPYVRWFDQCSGDHRMTQCCVWYYDVSSDVVSTCTIFQSPSTVITTFTVGPCIIIQWSIFVWVSVISLAVGRDRAIHYIFLSCVGLKYSENFSFFPRPLWWCPAVHAHHLPLLLPGAPAHRHSGCTRVSTHRRTSSMVFPLPCAVLPTIPTQWCACSLSPSLPCPRC